MPYQYNPLTGRFEFVDDTGGFTPAAGGFTPAPPQQAFGAAQQVPEGAGLQNPAAAPRARFAQRRPKLASFLQNLAPALAAIQQPQAQTTPYPVSGLSGVLNALSAGGQTFAGGLQNIEEAQFGRLLNRVRQGPGVRGGLQALETGQELTPAQAQGVQFVTGRDVETGRERGIRKGTEIGAEPAAKLAQAEKEFNFTSDLARKQYDFEREKFTEDIRRFGTTSGLDARRVKAAEDEVKNRFGGLYADLIDKFPYTNRPVQQPIVEKMVLAQLAGRPADLSEEELAQLPSEGIEQIKLRGRLGRNRTLQDLAVKSIEGRLTELYGGDWATSAKTPPEVKAAISFLSDPTKMALVDDDFTVRDQYEQHVNALVAAGVWPKEAGDNWLKQILGGQLQKLRPKGPAAEAGPRGATRPTAPVGNNRAEIERLRNLPQRTPEQEKELSDRLASEGF